MTVLLIAALVAWAARVPAQEPAPAARAQAAPAAAAETVVIVRAPRPGERLARTFSLDHELVVQRMATVERGVEQVIQEHLSLRGAYALEASDEVLDVADGRATRFRRGFGQTTLRVDLEREAEGTVSRHSGLQAASPLAGASALFTWVPARAEYGRLYDAGEASEEFLARIRADLDATAALPPGPVAVGAEWPLDLARLHELFACGGEMPLRFGTGSHPLLVRTIATGVGGPLHPILAGQGSGRATARLTALEDGPEGRRARITLDLDVRFERDQRAILDANLSPVELGEGARVARADVRWSFRGQGELVWSLAQGRPVSLALSGAEEVSLSAEFVRPDRTAQSELKLSGGLRLALRVVPGAPAGPR